MDNQALPGAGREAFAAFRNQPIIYCGKSVRRGLALLMESEHSDDVGMLVEIGLSEPTDEPMLPDDEARPLIAASLVNQCRGQADFFHRTSFRS